MTKFTDIPRMTGNVLHPNPYHFGRRFINWENQRTSAWHRTKAIGLARSFYKAAGTEKGMVFDTNFILQELPDAEDGSQRYIFFDGQQRLTTVMLVALGLLRLYRDSLVDTANSAGTQGLSQVSADALLRLHPASAISGEQQGGEPHTGGAYTYIDATGEFRPWLSISRGDNENFLDDFLANLVFAPKATLLEMSDRSVREELRSPEARLANNFLGILEYFSSLNLDDAKFVELVNCVADFRCYYNIYKVTDEATRAFTNSNNGAQMAFAGIMRVIVAGIYNDRRFTEALNRLDTKLVYEFLPKSVAEVNDQNGADLIYRLVFSSTMLEPLHSGEDTAADIEQFQKELPTADDAIRFFNATVSLIDTMNAQTGGKFVRGKSQTKNQLFAQFLYIVATQGNDTSAWYAALYLLRKLENCGRQQLREVLDAFTRLYINVTLFGSVDPSRDDQTNFYRLVRSTVETLGVENLNREKLDAHFASLAGPWKPNTSAKLRAHMLQKSFEPKAMSVLGQLLPVSLAYADTARAIRAKQTIPGLIYNYAKQSFTTPSKDCLSPMVAVDADHSALIRSGSSFSIVYPGSYLVTNYKLDLTREDSQSIAKLLERAYGTNTRLGDSSSLQAIADRLDSFNDSNPDAVRGVVDAEFVAAARVWQATRLADAYGVDSAPFEKLQERLSQRFGDSAQVFMVAGVDCFSFDLSVGELSVAGTEIKLEDWGAALEISSFDSQEQMLEATELIVNDEQHSETLAEVLAD